MTVGSYRLMVSEVSYIVGKVAYWYVFMCCVGSSA